MRMFAATAMGACLALSGSVLADGEDDLLYRNRPFEVAPGENDGVFSDAMASQGQYEINGYALGQRFSVLQGGSTVKSIRFWAASEYVFEGESQDALSLNITNIEIAIFRVVSGTNQFPEVARWILPTASISQDKTGNVIPVILSPVFQMDTALAGNVTLSGGDYVLSIGGVLADPFEGSRFAWVDGEADGANPATRSYASISGSWGSWVPFTQPGSPSGAFELYGEIPAPSTLLALAALAPRRRRRPD